jgi:hypothetical protein
MDYSADYRLMAAANKRQAILLNTQTKCRVQHKTNGHYNGIKRALHKT